MSNNKALIKNLTTDLDSIDFFDSIPALSSGYTGYLSPILKNREVIFGHLLMSLLSPIANPDFSIEAISLLWEKIEAILGDKKPFELEIINDNFEVDQEYVTHENGRIDFLIRTIDSLRIHSRAIIIELKLDSELTNDLLDYYNSINVENRNKVGVILSLQNTAHLIDGTPFVYIPLIEYLRDFMKIANRISGLSAREKYFLGEIDFYLTDLERSFYGQNTSGYLEFLLRNKKIINEIDAVYGISESEAERTLFLRRNVDGLKKLKKIRDYVLANIQDYLMAESARQNRSTYHLKENRMFYLKGKRYKLFSDLVRMSLDYSWVDTLVSEMEIEVSIDVSQIETINEQSVRGSLIAKFQALNLNNTSFVPNGRRDGTWEVFFTKKISSVTELKEFNALFVRLIDEMLVPVEEVVESVLFDKVVFVRNELNKLGSDLLIKYELMQNSQFAASNGEEVMIDSVSDSFYIITYKLTLNNEILISLWFWDSIEEDVNEGIEDNFQRKSLFEGFDRMLERRDFEDGEKTLSYVKLLEGKFDLHYSDRSSLSAMLKQVWDKTQVILNEIVSEKLLKENGRRN